MLSRHPHDHGFAALVLSGGYVEAGDTGRHRMEAGEVLLHQSWESHLDRFDGRGAEVLVLRIADRDIGSVVGRIADPDARFALIARALPAQAFLLIVERATVGEYYQRCFNEEIPTGGFTTRKFN